MPEGPELCINSRFVNRVCSGRLFKGKVVKSAVSKCSVVEFYSEAYTISSEARGKEMALILRCSLEPQNKLRLLFRFGMSGKFKFSRASEIPKHAHLQFFSWGSGPGGGELATSPDVLSFVDVRRFGTWRVMPVGWGESRGPDPMFDYDAFRSNVLDNLEDSAFNRPICEVLLNQKYFNGIGNYLRAEILFRANTPPFMCARKVLEPLCGASRVKGGGGGGGGDADILWLCHKVPLEVVDLKHKLGKCGDMALTQEDYVGFCQWLQCYENPGMKNMKDHNGRTIWFKGEVGAMGPKIQKSRKVRRGKGRAPGSTAMYKTESGVEEREPATAEEKVKEEPGETTGRRKMVKKTKKEAVKLAVKKESGQSESREGDGEGVGGGASEGESETVAGRQSRKRGRRAAEAGTEKQHTEPPPKKSKTGVNKGGVSRLPTDEGRPKKPSVAKQRRQKSSTASLPIRRSSRIKNAERRK